MTILTSPAIKARVPFIDAFLGMKCESWNHHVQNDEIKGVAGWGAKASAAKARRIAHDLKVPVLFLEDGLLRSPLCQACCPRPFKFHNLSGGRIGMTRWHTHRNARRLS